MAEIEGQKDRFTTEAQNLEAIAADYLKQAKDCRDRAQKCQEKAREKVLEELQGFAAQMQVMLRKADSYGVEEKAHEILSSIFPSHSNISSDEPDPPDRQPTMQEIWSDVIPNSKRDGLPRNVSPMPFAVDHLVLILS